VAAKGQLERAQNGRFESGPCSPVFPSQDSLTNLFRSSLVYLLLVSVAGVDGLTHYSGASLMGQLKIDELLPSLTH